MKLNIGKRILMFFHWLFSLLICAAFVTYLIWPDFAGGIYDKLAGLVGSLNIKIIGGAILAIYLVLTVMQIILILRRGRRSERGFITVDASDTGRVRIAVSAIEQMVRQSVINIDGISEMKISIDSKDDAIVIGVAAAIINGSHVPTITMNMQRSIRQFVEMNCGVAVRSVAITINSVANPNEAPRRRRRGDAAVPAPAVVPTRVQPEPQAPVAVEPQTPAYEEPTTPSYEEPAAPTYEEPTTPAYEEPQAPVFEKPQAEADSAELFTPASDIEDSIPGIDFNYKPRLELTPTVGAPDAGYEAGEPSGDVEGEAVPTQDGEDDY